jgi:hypothetical protein
LMRKRRFAISLFAATSLRPCTRRWLQMVSIVRSPTTPFTATTRPTSPGPAGLRFGSGRNCRLELWSQAHTRYQLNWHIKRLAEITSDQEHRCPWRGSHYQLPTTRGDLQIEQPQIKMAAVLLLKRDAEYGAGQGCIPHCDRHRAQQQRARSFELCAALSLAKLYHSTDRPADAHAVLAPALEGFSPTPEFPEIAERKRFSAH